MLRLLRAEYWPKNLLVFLAPAAAHRLDDPAVWKAAGAAFLAFCSASSAQYVLNDVLGVEEDRSHPVKRSRPVAAGRISKRPALFMALVLGALSMLFAAWNAGLAFVIASYHAIALAYSWRLHRWAFVDLAALVALFLLRVSGGGAAAAVEPSYWLIGAAAFPILSLAALKRYCDLEELAGAPYRGYAPADMRTLRGIGVAGAAAGAAVLALYIGGDQASRYYRNPHYLWVVCPIPALLLFRAWRQARGGQLCGHPLPALFHDPLVWLAAGAVFLIGWLAA